MILVEGIGVFTEVYTIYQQKPSEYDMLLSLRGCGLRKTSANPHPILEDLEPYSSSAIWGNIQPLLHLRTKIHVGPHKNHSVKRSYGAPISRGCEPIYVQLHPITNF